MEAAHSVENALLGDRWADGERKPGDQTTLMMTRCAEWICHDDHPLHMPGDNFLVDFDLSDDHAPIGSRLRIGAAILEVPEEPHKGCENFTDRFGLGALKWVNTF